MIECRNDPPWATVYPPSARRRIATRGDQASPASTWSAGAVRATEPSTVSCGTVMPSEPQKSRVHAPPAHTTARVATTPCSVTAATTRPAARSMPRTAQDVTMRAPARAAPRAMAALARLGSARPSLAVYIAPAHLTPSGRSTSSSAGAAQHAGVEPMRPCDRQPLRKLLELGGSLREVERATLPEAEILAQLRRQTLPDAQALDHERQLDG